MHCCRRYKRIHQSHRARPLQKDVSLTGAACITAVLNALPGYGIPYVFGGDGAALTVPASVVPQVQRILGAARALPPDQFDLALRAGIVLVADVRKKGAHVLVARFRLSPGNSMAMLTGVACRWPMRC